MKSSRDVYKAIYNAALEQNQDKLDKVLKEYGGSVNVYQKIKIDDPDLAPMVIPPVAQLAIEKNHAAVKFLLMNKASMKYAAFGFAINNDEEAVKNILDSAVDNEINPNRIDTKDYEFHNEIQEFAAQGYAISHRYDNKTAKKILDEIPSEGQLINSIIGLAFAKNTMQLGQLLKSLSDTNGVPEEYVKNALLGAAMGGHDDLIENRLPEQPTKKMLEAIIVGYATANNLEQCKKYVERYKEIYPVNDDEDEDNQSDLNRILDLAIGQFAKGNHTDGVDYCLENGARTSYRSKGYLEGGHPSNAREFASNDDLNIEHPTQTFTYTTKSSQKIYDAIYHAAINESEKLLKEALQYGGIDIYQKVDIEINKTKTPFIISPISQLAIEGKVNAVDFLLKHGADKDHAVYGYAVGNKPDQVTKLLKKGANKAAAICGYANRGYHEEIKKLNLDTKEDIDSALFGYATGGFINEVDNLIKLKKASPMTAIYAYALVNDVDSIETYLRKYFSHDREADKNAIDEAIFAHAFAGHIDEVNKLLSLGSEYAYFVAARGYAAGGYVDEVNKYLYKVKAKDVIVEYYHKSGHTTPANHLDLDIKIEELKQYGIELQNKNDDASKRKGKYASQLATDIASEVKKFRDKPDDADNITAKLNKLITDGRDNMGGDRRALDYIAHIALALTVIGLAVMIGHKLLSKSHSLFLNRTERQKKLDKADELAQKVTAPKKKT